MCVLEIGVGIWGMGGGGTEIGNMCHNLVNRYDLNKQGVGKYV